MAGGMCGRRHAWQIACVAGGMHGRGQAGGMRGMGHAWQERWPLQWSVHILVCLEI